MVLLELANNTITERFPNSRILTIISDGRDSTMLVDDLVLIADEKVIMRGNISA
jgi:hypothetical protein